ncbi:uncharacterized protein LOC129739728 [Uranotaenia lowii]|uniref:uncharacterized protein LOC129739728 n=1 Tax=Uranotaenia lowii TaxID=190385 RepID=UPI0024788CFF|nr:uncharacterized protein LOC129739728 [Uranotaenia lowii]
MEEIRRGDPETHALLEAHKFNNLTLMLLNEERLKKIGLKEDPILFVLDIIEKTRNANSPTLRIEDAENISPIRIKLQRNSRFAQNVLYKKLDKQLPLDHKELCHMVRILCDDWKNRVFLQNYPTTAEQQEMAQQILNAFPYLRNTPGNDSTTLFSKNSGKGTGHRHSGIIHNFFRNLCHHVPAESKKFTRSPKPGILSEEIANYATNLSLIEGTAENFSYIKEDMAKCLPCSTI